MDRLDEMLIIDYMKLENKQSRMARRLSQIEHDFWQQSFMRSPLNIDENGNPNSIIRYDKQVNTMVDLRASIGQNERLLAFKQHYWQLYLNTLNSAERGYLLDRYRLRKECIPHRDWDIAALNECNQIEEATGHRFGLLADPAVDTDADVETMMNHVLGMIS